MFTEGTILLSFPNYRSSGSRRRLIVHISSINRDFAEFGHVASVAQKIPSGAHGKKESEALRSLYTHGQVAELEI
jgi:hypothetical protein